MAAAIKYFDTAKIGHARLTTGVTASDGSGSETGITWLNTAPASDWMLTKITAVSTSATNVGNIADSLLFMFIDDATTQRCFRVIDLGDPAVGAANSIGYAAEINFGPEFIFPAAATCTVSFAISVTPTAGNLDLVIFAQAA